MICQGREMVRLMSHECFAGQPVRPDIVRFVSVLSRRLRSTPSTPMRFPSRGKWLLKILGREGRFVFGVYRRHMKVISYLGTMDRLFGVPVTTRNWNTILAVAKVLRDAAPVKRGDANDAERDVSDHECAGSTTRQRVRTHDAGLACHGRESRVAGAAALTRRRGSD